MFASIYQEQSVPGLEVEVINLIGTLPRCLPTSRFLFPSVISFSWWCYFQTSLSSSHASLVICPNLPSLHSLPLLYLLLFHPSLSYYLCLFISHLFSAAGTLWSLQSSRGIETSIAARDRDRTDKIKGGEREREKRKSVAPTQSHTDRSVLTAHTHAHLRLIGLTAFTLTERQLDSQTLLLTQMPGTIVFQHIHDSSAIGILSPPTLTTTTLLLSLLSLSLPPCCLVWCLGFIFARSCCFVWSVTVDGCCGAAPLCSAAMYTVGGLQFWKHAHISSSEQMEVLLYVKSQL